MKGMQKIRRGRGFRGVCRYAEAGGEFIGGNVIGSDADSIARELRAISSQRPDIAKPVWHNSLRLPAGEQISNEQWLTIADNYMQQMGFSDNHPRAYYLHDDPAGQHIHIVASRVNTDGAVYLGKNENLKSTKIIRELERKYGLTVTRGAEYDARGRVVMPDRAGLKSGEINRSIRTGDPAARAYIQNAIDSATTDRPNLDTLRTRLDALGVQMRTNQSATTGRISGLSFERNGVAFKGSQLGKSYSFARLANRLTLTPDERPEPKAATKKNLFDTAAAMQRASHKSREQAEAERQARQAAEIVQSFMNIGARHDKTTTSAGSSAVANATTNSTGNRGTPATTNSSRPHPGSAATVAELIKTGSRAADSGAERPVTAAKTTDLLGTFGRRNISATQSSSDDIELNELLREIEEAEQTVSKMPLRTENSSTQPTRRRMR